MDIGTGADMSVVRPLIAGNWKMNGTFVALDEVRALAASLEEAPARCEVALCPPATLVRLMADLAAGTGILVGGQDCRGETGGAFTGDISAEMLAEAGAELVILGHSERRAGHGETDALVAVKVEGALRAGLRPIVCVGETLEERDAGWALGVVTGQVEDSLPDAVTKGAFAIAYEPVWAIGSGRTPTIEQIEEIHGAIRAVLTRRFGDAGKVTPILYGGSV